MKKNIFERESGIARILRSSPSEEAALLAYFGEKLRNQEKYAFEKEKNEEESETIRIILNHVAQFVRDYGGQPVDLTEANIHLLDISRVREEELNRMSGWYLPDKQAIFVLPHESTLLTAKFIVHEV